MVKSGVHDPDYGTSIASWRGRISEVDPDNNLICIQWDSVTLNYIPEKIIQACEKDNLNWEVIYLSPVDVEKTESRDHKDDVQDSVQRLSSKYYWFSFGDQGERIQDVLNRKSDPDTEDDPKLIGWNIFGMFLLFL
ncbi:MAG: hypothetical protein U5L00_07840 [Desulfovermiculus sp.]|nr:hypothetical protein [Desulfovermiculus sp.]